MSRIVFPPRDNLPHKIRKPATVTEWGRLHDRCFGCGTNLHLQNHHIIGGSGRSDEVCNLFRACEWECHPRCEGLVVNGKPPFMFAEILMMKKIKDPHNFDLKRLQELLGRQLDLEELFR